MNHEVATGARHVIGSSPGQLDRSRTDATPNGDTSKYVNLDAGVSDERLPRILVIPGLDGHVNLWQEVASSVLAGMRPVWFDHSKDEAFGGLEGLAERALQVLDADPDGDEPAYVLGESFGGAIALVLARRFPTRVRGLLLICTFGWYPAHRAGRLGLVVSRLLGDRISRVVLRMWHPFSMPTVLGFRVPRALVRAFLSQTIEDVAAYRRKVELALSFDAREWLHEITQPTFILVGTWDPIVPTSSARTLADQIPRADLHCVRGSHLAWCIRPTEVGQFLTGWCARVDNGAAPTQPL